ncbi:MAG: hypothetical protein ACOC55_01125 [Candidatus Natronoplasma sp.]
MDEGEGFRVRRKHDRRIRRVFYILLLLFLFWILFSGAVFRGRDLFTFLGSILSGLLTVFLLTGFVSFYLYRKEGLIKTKEMLKALLVLSFLLSFITLLAGFVFFRPFLILTLAQYMPGFSAIPRLLTIFLLLFFSYFLVFIFVLLQGFGLASVMVLFQRMYFSGLLEDVRKITPASKGEIDEGLSKEIYYKFLRWIFDIPSVLDTRGTKIEKSVFQKGFPWKKFKSAFFLESIVALLLAVYISLNPLLLQERSLSELFAFASSASYFIPVMVLPIFIYLRLEVKLPGPAEDFYLFNGVRSRLMSLIIALGTVLLFVRLALETIDVEMLVLSFTFYFMGFIVNTFFVTFVYFNYFELHLAEDILQDQNSG